MARIIVTKCTDLVNSNYSLTLEENRLINLSSGKIYFKNIVNEGHQCKLTVKEYSEQYGISIKEAKKQIKEARDSLLGKTVYIESFSSEPIKWIDDVVFDTNDDLYVVFSWEMMLYLFNLTERFVQYDLDKVKNIKNPHTLRLYEVCKTKNHLGGRYKLDIRVEQLKSLMSLEGEYSRNSDFKRMLNGCIEDINKHTDIHVTLEEKKLGKKLVSFTFKLKKPESEALAQAA